MSSALRIHALKSNDRELNQESGFPSLVRYLQYDIAANAEAITVGNARADIVAVCELIEGQFRSEREALADPEQAQALVANLTEVKRAGQPAAQRRRQVAADAVRRRAGPAGRRRPRPAQPHPGQITKQADESIDEHRPRRGVGRLPGVALPPGRRGRHPLLHVPLQPGRELVLRVGEHFGEDSGTIAVNLAIMNPNQVLGERAGLEHRPRAAEARRGHPGHDGPARRLRRHARCSACSAAWPAWPC